MLVSVSNLITLCALFLFYFRSSIMPNCDHCVDPFANKRFSVTTIGNNSRLRYWLLPLTIDYIHCAYGGQGGFEDNPTQP